MGYIYLFTCDRNLQKITPLLLEVLCCRCSAKDQSNSQVCSMKQECLYRCVTKILLVLHGCEGREFESVVVTVV